MHSTEVEMRAAEGGRGVFSLATSNEGKGKREKGKGKREKGKGKREKDMTPWENFNIFSFRLLPFPFHHE